jgi:hypothetical protein
MNKQELNQNLDFLFQENNSIDIIIYAILDGDENPKKLDIKAIDLPLIKKLFIDSIKKSVYEESEYVVLPISTADERGKCFYEYDLELPKELNRLTDVIGNDTIDNFNFNDEQIAKINSLIIVLSNLEHQVSLFKKLSPLEIIGRGGIFLKKAAERFEKFNNNLLRISPGFQALSINGTVIILNLKTIEKSFGFTEVIKREAIHGIDAIRNMSILQNIEELEGLIDNITFARKLIMVARSSPVIQNNIPNSQIINFTKIHPALKGKIKYNTDGTLINLHTKTAKNLFVKLLNDDFLTSELTKLFYDSLAKDGIEIIETIKE